MDGFDQTAFAAAFTLRSGVRDDRAYSGIFIRPCLSGIIRYRRDAPATKTQGT